MGKIDKLLEKMKTNPAGWTISDLYRVAGALRHLKCNTTLY